MKGKLKKLKPYKGCTGSSMDRRKLAAPFGNVYVYRMVAEHFCSDEFIKLCPDEPMEVHHINPKAEDLNSADNLQRLPKSIHEGATFAQNHATEKEMDEYQQKEIAKALKKNSDIPVIWCDLTPLLESLCKYSQTHAGVAYYPKKDGSCRVETIPPQRNNANEAEEEQK